VSYKHSSHLIRNFADYTDVGNTDDASQQAPKGTNVTTDISVQLFKQWPNITTDVVSKILELYPNDPAKGCPYDTGDGVLLSGLQDKRTNSIWTDTNQFAPRRFLSQTMTKAGNDVYAWRYNQVTQNVTIDIGRVHFSVSPFQTCRVLPQYEN
jgi:acetylcholinesterase